MNELNCTCCGNDFNSNEALEKHRNARLQYAIDKYTKYIQDMNKQYDICDCL